MKIAAGRFPGIRVTDATADLSVEYTQPGVQTLTWVVTMMGEPGVHPPGRTGRHRRTDRRHIDGGPYL